MDSGLGCTLSSVAEISVCDVVNINTYHELRKRGAQFRNVLLFVGLAAIWGSGFVAIEAGLAYYPPVLYASLRNGFAAVLMVGYAVLVTDQFRPHGWREWLAVGASGSLIIGAYQALLFFGQQATTSGVAAIITGITPILTIGFARVVPPMKRLNRRELVGLVVAFAGIILIVRPSPSQFGGGMDGEPILLLGAGCFALGSVITQRVTAPLPAETQQAWAMGIGALLIYIASVMLGESVVSVSWTGEAIGALLYLILVPSGLGFLCYFKILDRFSSTEANLVMNASPIFAALLGWVVLDERLGIVTIGGFAVIVVGFILFLSSKLAAQGLIFRLFQ